MAWSWPNIPGHKNDGRAVAFGLALLILVFAPIPIHRSAGWVWDLGAALGFWALAGLVLQMLPCRDGIAFQRHRFLAPWVLALCLVHALWFLIVDPITRFDLRNGGAVHLWAALAGLAVLAGLILQARLPERFRLYPTYRAFRSAHRHAALCAIAAVAIHVLFSGYYVAGAGLIAVLPLILVALLRPAWAGLSPSCLGLGGAAATLIFVLMRLP
ncbi:hypothetical protein [Paracoccus homiensis]|uniref:Ferric reductase like transmembrane component n=1 Tax=Paracoccus homiensis TaxID=364199 RepID=A0A1I0H3W5_9RHOB|nr:hypothetical protein [Paracoccus homiensis]SET78414.1 hypothetical protein SAMN04489858_1105 [Paracoccus homiensis]